MVHSDQMIGKSLMKKLISKMWVVKRMKQAIVAGDEERTVNTSRPKGAEGRSSPRDLRKLSREGHSQRSLCPPETVSGA